MEGCWFLAISQNVVKNLKDYINLKLSGCFEHIRAKFCPPRWCVLLEFVHGKLEVLGLTQACL